MLPCLANTSLGNTAPVSTAPTQFPVIAITSSTSDTKLCGVCALSDEALLAVSLASHAALGWVGYGNMGHYAVCRLHPSKLASLRRESGIPPVP